MSVTPLAEFYNLSSQDIMAYPLSFEEIEYATKEEDIIDMDDVRY